MDYELLQALIATESGFDAGAVSPKGAIGLMQVMPATAGRFGVAADTRRTVAQKLLDPALDVSPAPATCAICSICFPAVWTWPWLPTTQARGRGAKGGQPDPGLQETQNYVRTVLGLYAQLKPPAPVLAQRAGPGRVRMELSGGALNRGNLPATRVARPRT